MAKKNGGYRFRVSDAVPVPLRGMMLRLRLLEGTPQLGDLEPGDKIRIVAPDGAARVARIKAIAMTEGRPTQERLERERQLDVVIGPEDARQDGRAVGIGWYVEG